jgi:hypothetical protein
VARPGLEVALLPGADAALEAELRAFFEACPRSYAQQTPAWRDVITALGVDEPLFLGCRRAGDGELVGVLPAYRFVGPRGAVLNSVPQAGPLGGVACRPGADARAVHAALLDAYLELGRARDCACVSLITSPLWPDVELYAEPRAPDFVLHNTCQVLDLEAALDAAGEPLLASRNLRRSLARAAAAGLRIDEEQSPENVEEWIALHEARHREIGATPLPAALFRGALAHMVPAGKARFFFVRAPDTTTLVAGGFYVLHGQVIDALMPAMRSSHAHVAPNAHLALHTLRWARARGLRWYNWQASPPEGGVRRYKLQWGSRDVEYAYLTWATGDLAQILRATPEEIRRDYPWHYVVPFDRLGAGEGTGAGAARASSRDAAWRAAQGAR